MTISVDLTAFLAQEGLILDVRSPSEYAHARIPGAVNLPLFSDAERCQIGTLYKQQGRETAVEEGLRMVGPRLIEIVEQAKHLLGSQLAKVHCWRGGMRSGSIAWLLQTAGLATLTLEGGYKTFRRYVCDLFESLPAQQPRLLVLGGLTGSGKTEILELLREQGEQVINLEDLAGHRGSSFGMVGMGAQPSNEQFENSLAMEWARIDPRRTTWMEDESRLIGHCKIPDALYDLLRHAPTLVIERPLEERLENLLHMYGQAAPEELIQGTHRLSRRLGGLRTRQISDMILRGELSAAIQTTLKYYDAAYLFGLVQRKGQVIKLPGQKIVLEEWAQRLIHISQENCLMRRCDD